ncbi:hypothetical protein RZS08_33285, partial [Arthrospira platensis SPKY1]|nr:hypothetical protein [Arthrospira platensis SPKY1]
MGDGYSFYYSDGNSLEFLGSALVLNPGSAPDTNYLTLTVDGDLLFEFPLHYGDQMSDDIEGTNTVFAGGSPFVTQRTGTTTTEVDGYGTLITPLGTFNNVLRVKRTESISDSFMGFATTQDVER